MKNLISDLKWYSEKAEAISRYLRSESLDGVMAVVKELELDAGKRALKHLTAYRIESPGNNSKNQIKIDRLTTALRDIKKHQEIVCKSSALFSRPWMIANKALGYSDK